MKLFGQAGGKRIVAFVLACVCFWGALSPAQSIEVEAEENIDGEIYTITAYSTTEGGVVTICDGNGSTIDSGTGVAKDSKCKITAISNEGYEITDVAVKKDGENWLPDGTTEEDWWNDAEYFLEDLVGHKETFTFELEGIQANYEFEIIFTKKTYTISLIQTGNGTVTTSQGEFENGSVMTEAGANVSLIFSPDKGKQINSLVINNVSIKPEDFSEQVGGNYQYTISNIHENYTVVVGFSDIQTESYSAAGIIIKNQDGEVIYPDANNICYAESIILSADGKKLSLEEQAFWKYQSELKLEETIELDKVYMRNERQWFGTTQKVTINPVVTLVVDNKAPVFANLGDELWIDADSLSVNISGTLVEDNLDYLVWATEEKSTLQDIFDISEENRIPVTTEGSFSKELPVDGDVAKIYLYAVDKIGHYSGKQVAVYRDSTNPMATAITIVSPDSINKQDYGNFLCSDLVLQITANDESIASVSGKASGVKAIEVYAGEDTIPTYIKQVDSVVTNDSSCNVSIIIAVEDAGSFIELNELRIAVVDGVGNKSSEYKLTDTIAATGMTNSKVMLENNEPTIVITPSEEALYVDDSNQVYKFWYQEIPNIDYSVSEIVNDKMGSGLKEGYVSFNANLLAAYNKNYEYEDYSAEHQTENETIQKSGLGAYKEGENTLLICYTDQAGNIAKAEHKICIDTHVPVINSFSINKNSANADKVLAFMPFGNYANTELEVTVMAEDAMRDNYGNEILPSGLNTITLKVNGVDYQTLPVTDGKAVFLIPADGLGEEKIINISTISAYATDNVGNVSALCEMNTSNSNLIQHDSLVIETIKPITVLSSEQGYISEKNGNIYNNAVTDLTISVSDVDAGLQSTIITVDGVEVVNDICDGTTQVQENSYSVSIGGEQVGGENKDKYVLEVTVIDNAGNKRVTTSEIYTDEKAPAILNFDMRAAGNIEADGTDFSVNEMEYGYYFRENTSVTVYASDGTEPADSGVKAICYYTININGTKSTETTVNVDAENKAVFTIPAGFKGQIFVCACDQLNNFSTYVTPKSMVVETAAQHAMEEHIWLEKENSVYKDANNNELYLGDVTILMTIRDTFSGIKSVEWYIEAPNDTEANQGGNLSIDNNGEFILGSNVDGWSKTKTEKNLITELQKSIIVSSDSNDIVLHVLMIDRAGNRTEKEIVFGIDKTLPVIDIAFDNEVPDAESATIFRENRTATITVTERNFNAEDFRIKIENSEGTIPENTKWLTQLDAQNPNETKHVTMVTFSEDGDYSMEVSGYDMAHNAAETVTVEEFTIDKTLPKISVTYDNNNSLNGNYYATGRTAIVQIEEHNFSKDKVEIAGQALDNGASISFPTVSEWSREGDVHTATIACEEDGFYSFSINYTDLAGNKAETYTGEEFYVDRTSPTIEIIGVSDMSANNGDVVPQILLSDTNFDTDGIVLTLTGANRGNVELDGTYMNQNNGQIFEFHNFPYEQVYDDVYELTATLVDLAGNESTETILFSVNRFGSVYIFDDSLKEIAGTYIREEMDVRLTEINADRLEHDSIKVVLNVNGSPRDLKEGIDYFVEKTGGNGEWYQYNYVIDRSLFAGDGRYTITLHSEDAAGNVNENIDENKKAEISFGVDKTAPVIIPIDIMSDSQYALDKKSASIVVNDNLVLENVRIYIDENECDYVQEGESYNFTIPSAIKRQDITIVALDAAGNRAEYVISGVLVTTNLFVRWYNNKPLFVGTIVAIAGMGIAGTAGVVMHKNAGVIVKRKKNN